MYSMFSIRNLFFAFIAKVNITGNSSACGMRCLNMCVWLHFGKKGVSTYIKHIGLNIKRVKNIGLNIKTREEYIRNKTHTVYEIRHTQHTQHTIQQLQQNNRGEKAAKEQFNT